MNQINRKSKISSFFELLSSHCEYIMTFALGLLMIVQRFLSGVYKPVMDDWFLYGDLYKGISNRLANQFRMKSLQYARSQECLTVS
ncbi:hypothetical protein DXA10_10895 [Firmicutes bacterium AM55-24TS]|nr:hypothetical protein DXA10_10895 [Firmicutes bacterium AM55-24TS]